MNPSSLDWSIQSALSSLFPPFEATAPTVLSQLFRTIEERYHGDALQCLLDYLIPAKHILESVQQAACAEYSDVLFRCEGWPLCLRDRVVIQLAPINPLLLRPGDFYLQVEPFGEQSARIVLKSLLVQEDLLTQENLVLQAGFRVQEGPTVEETPVPETSYPCIFTEAWLQEVNEGRHGNQLHQCVLSSDQGIVKVPWTEVVNPEFLDKPKAKIRSEAMTSCSTAALIMQDNQSLEQEPQSQFPVNMAPLEIETMILPAKDGVAVSVRLVESSSRLVKVDQGKTVSSSVGKPVGWVSPNTWDSRHNRELEGEYVDLLDFAKEKETLAFNKAAIPTVPVSFRPAPAPPKRDGVPCVQASGMMNELCVPCSKNKQLSQDLQKGSESKCRHRQSYLAALRNPVSFEKVSVMAPLKETCPELVFEEQAFGIESQSCSSGQGLTQPVHNSIQSYKTSVQQNDNIVQPNMNTKHHQNSQPSPLTCQQPLLTEDLHKTVLERKIVSDNKHPCLSEAKRQEPSQIRTSSQKHAKTQHLPKMGLRALPDHSSHRQESNAYKCPGVGRKQIMVPYGPASQHKDPTQPTEQRPSLLHHPQHNENMLQHQHSPMDHKPFYDNKACAGSPGSPVQVLKVSGKSRSKGRSASSVSETAKECLQVDKMTNRSRSDVCPEIIPMVPAIHSMQNKKYTPFLLASPKLDRRKGAKNDASTSGTAEPQFHPPLNGVVLQSPIMELLSATQAQISSGHVKQLTPLSQDPSIKGLLQLGIISLPGSRDRAGRAVLEVYGGKKGWGSSLLSLLELWRLLLYLHSIPRREVRDLGLTVVIDNRKGSPPSVLYKALFLLQEQARHAVHTVLLLVDKDQSPRPERQPGLQMEIITSLKALHKTIDGQQLSSEFEGTFPYNHMDWLQFRQKLSVFELDLQGAALLLQKAIKKLDSSNKTDTVEDVKSCIQEQKSSMKEVLEDTRMVMLQREGGAILARMRKEEFKFAQSEDYRDSMGSVTSLYNQVEEGVHTLVMRSNQSLQHLSHVFMLRETEDQLNTSRKWCEEEQQRWQRNSDLTEKTRERLEQRLTDLHSVLTEAKVRKEKGMMMMKEVERKIQGACYSETDSFHINVTKFKTNMAAFLIQAEQHKSDLESFIRLHGFCEQVLSLTKECSHYLEQMEVGCYPVKVNISKLQTFQERFKAFSPHCFEEEKSNVVAMKHSGELRVWKEAWAECQDVKQKLEEKLLECDGVQKPLRAPQTDVRVLRNAEASLQALSPSISSSTCGDMEANPELSGVDSQTQSQESCARSDSEALNCLKIHYKPERKASEGGNAPLVVSDVCSVETKNCKEEVRAELLRQTQIEQTQTNPQIIGSTCEQNSPSALQNQLKESNHPPSVLVSSTDNGSSLQNVLPIKRRTFSRKHQSEPDLEAVYLAAKDDRSPWKPALGRSHSEGSCESASSSISTCSPLPMCKKHSTDKHKVLLDDQDSVASHQDRLYTEFSNTQSQWAKTDSKDKPSVPQDEEQSLISRQESFCSSVSSPGQCWMKEDESSGIPLNGRSSGSFPDDAMSPDRLENSSAHSPTMALENSSNLLKLQHIMEELLQTEREYVKALGYVMEHYLPELERPDVPQDLRGQRGSIFGNLEKLRDFHQHHFLKELELCLREPFRVGRCFLRHKESFGLYALYSKNKPHSDNLLIHHGKEFFKQKQQQLGDKMDLSSYLLKPVQRISKYSLLLQDMLRECDLGSQRGRERAEIQAALEVIQFQLRHGNNLLAMDDIQDCDVNLKEQGQLIRQDEFLVSYRKKKCYRHVFLFQDLILFSKTKKTEVGNDTYIYKQSFKTSDIGMTHNCGDSGLCFEIWFRRRKSQDTYTLQAGTREIKEAWTKDLERILWEQAVHNKEIRMQERVFMGIGYKPFMDIMPSEAAICDRAINCALTGRDCKAADISGMADSQGRFPGQRPNSTGSVSCTSSSSSSSGRGSVSPVGYLIGASRRTVSESDQGRFSSPGVLEEYDIEQENSSQSLLVDSSESSGESVSGFSSSGYSCQSVTGGEHEENTSEMPAIGVRKAGPSNMERNKNKSKISPKPQSQIRDQPHKKVQDQGNNHVGKSTEV
ncbi:quattro isoform X1 [Pygocentrus nattereri]|uniref:Quattro n=1 Tax=Pygocentrus nattereri TaxID=42514 RepID=A0A3B4DDB3_PYGNA|nr:quattro isoform X1 [Pygocentrus nattereri]